MPFGGYQGRPQLGQVVTSDPEGPMVQENIDTWDYIADAPTASLRWIENPLLALDDNVLNYGDLLPDECYCMNGFYPAPTASAAWDRAQVSCALQTKCSTTQRLRRSQISRGSKNHKSGQCRPCFAFHSPEGCSLGKRCNFCHFPHSESKFAELSAYSARAAKLRSHRDLAKVLSFQESETCSDEPWYIAMPMSLSRESPHLSSAQAGPISP